ncbi:hypothetical protein RB595_010536 [Gaeumannomyces hyphopodioides]
MGNMRSKLVAAAADPASSSDEWELPSSPIERHVASRQAATDTPATRGDAASDAQIPPSPAPGVAQAGSSARPGDQPAPSRSAGAAVIDLTGEPSSNDESDGESNAAQPDTSCHEISVASAPAPPPPVLPRPVGTPPRPPMPAVRWDDYTGLDIHRGVPSPAVSIGSSVISVDGGSRYSSSPGAVVIDLTGEPSSGDESDGESDTGQPDTSCHEISVASAPAPPSPILPRPVGTPPRPPMPAVRWNDCADLDIHRGVPSPALSIGSSVISVDGGSRYSSSPGDAEVKTSALGAEEPGPADEHHLPEPEPEERETPAIDEAVPAQGPSSPASPRLAKPHAQQSPPRLSFSQISSSEIVPVSPLQEISNVKQELLDEYKETKKIKEPQLEPVINGHSDNESRELQRSQKIIGESLKLSAPAQVISPPINRGPSTPKKTQGPVQPVEESPKASTPAAVIASAIKPSARTPEKRKAQAQLLEMVSLYDSASSNSEDERRRKSELVGSTKYVVDEPAWATSRRQARRTGIPPIIPTKRRSPSPPKVTKNELLQLGKQAGLKSSWLSPIIGKKSTKLEGRPGVITIGSGRRHDPEVDGVGNLSADLWQGRERKRRLRESRERRDKRQTAVDELLDSLYAVANAAEPGDLAPTASTESQSSKAGQPTLGPGDARGATNTTPTPEISSKRRRNSDGAGNSLVPAKKPRFVKEREEDDTVEKNRARRARASTPAPDEWIERDRRQALPMTSTHEDGDRGIPVATPDKDSSSEGDDAVQEYLARRARRAATPAPDDWIERSRRQLVFPVVSSGDTDSGHANPAAVRDEASPTRKETGSGGVGAGRKAARQSKAGTLGPDKRARRRGRQPSSPVIKPGPDDGHVLHRPFPGGGGAGTKKNVSSSAAATRKAKQGPAASNKPGAQAGKNNNNKNGVQANPVAISKTQKRKARRQRLRDNQKMGMAA